VTVLVVSVACSVRRASCANRAVRLKVFEPRPALEIRDEGLQEGATRWIALMQPSIISEAVDSQILRFALECVLG